MDILFLIVLLCVAFFWGSHVEKSHYKSISEREKQLPPIPVILTNHRQPLENVASVKMISGNVVVGADYFKTTLSGLVNFFGGNIATLESVMERARREAVLRAKYQALDADFIADLRYETTEVSGGEQKESLKVEAYAYATAIYLNKHAL
jgi:uncharacterized protein YbjQ (UPF0145 family)